jgi:glycosyl transferase family 25
MWEFVDKVVYINLDSRPDRRAHMEKITQTFGDKVTRFPAIKHEKGSFGCTMSHIEILKYALKKNWGNVLILEDDAEWNNFDDGYAKLEKLVKNNFDVILLGGSTISHNTDTHKLHSALTTVAYLVNKSYIPIILQNFEEGFQQFQGNPDMRVLYAIDMYWKKLQSRDNWYVIMPCLVYQRPDYSDIEKTNVDYRWLMHLV